MKKAIFLFFFLLLPFALAEEVHYDPLDLIAPVFFNLSADFGTDLVHYYPINCGLPGTCNVTEPVVCENVTLPETNSSARCSIERSLVHGETYVKDDPFCDVHFSAPACDEHEPENVTHQLKFRFSGTEDQFIWTFLDENKTKKFDYESEVPFEFETEFRVECPDVGDVQDLIDRESQINITDSEFLNYCLRPFGTFAENLNNIHGEFMTSNNLLFEQVGSYAESNKNLARELAGCRKDVDSFFEFKEKFEKCEVDLIDNKQEELDARIALGEAEAKARSRAVWIILLLILDVIVGIAWLTMFTLNKALPGGGQ